MHSIQIQIQEYDPNRCPMPYPSRVNVSECDEEVKTGAAGARRWTTCGAVDARRALVFSRESHSRRRRADARALRSKFARAERNR